MPGGRVWKVHPMLGKPLSEETKRRISESLKRKHLNGEISYPFLGKTKDNCLALKKISEAHMNQKNHNWKGDKVGYHALHIWVKNHKPKLELCENCNKYPPYDLANISGEYKRDINDFKWLCRRCHMTEDNRMKNLVQFQTHEIVLEK